MCESISYDLIPILSRANFYNGKCLLQNSVIIWLTMLMKKSENCLTTLRILAYQNKYFL